MARDRRYKIQVGQRSRRWLIHLPPGFDDHASLPVVIMLHGGGATARSAAMETGWNELADQAGFLAVYPDALARDPNRMANFPANPQLWNDGSNRYFASRNEPDDISFLDWLLDELDERFQADMRRVFVTGFSNGASMAFRVGMELSGRITAIAPVAGTCWLNRIELQRPVPLCYITGTADPMNPVDGGPTKIIFEGSEKILAQPKPPIREALQKWAIANGFRGEVTSVQQWDGVRTETFHSGADAAQVICLTVDGLGHVWPGGTSPLPESVVGQPSNKLAGTQRIWQFFRQCTASL